VLSFCKNYCFYSIPFIPSLHVAYVFTVLIKELLSYVATCEEPQNCPSMRATTADQVYAAENGTCYVLNIGKDSAPIQLAQCLSCPFPVLKYYYFFKYNIRTQFYQAARETVIVWNCQNTDCSLRKKITVSFIIIFGTLSFPARRHRPNVWQT